jgi:NADH dehydrogenase
MTPSVSLQATPQRVTHIVILGGGVGGLTATRELERLSRGRQDRALVLVSRNNFFLMSPLLFEACSGVLELRHCIQPIRPCLRRARFIEANVEGVDVERRKVRVLAAGGAQHDLPYDHLVVALGAATNTSLIPGSELAHTFKSVADALRLRNHIIERFERAELERDPRRRQQMLTVVVIGGGLVGVELLGELTAFAQDIVRYYPHLRRDELRFHLFEGGPRLLHESTPCLGAYAARVLTERGATLHTATAVQAIEPGRVRAKDGDIESETVVLAAGIVPSAAAAAIAVERDRRGRIVTDAAMRSVSHPQVWAMGDCASIPDPSGAPYPALAQHALREARTVARNIHAVTTGRRHAPFVFRSLGTLAAFGHRQAVADIRGLRLAGFLAWWLRRTYYLFQMPRWDTRLRIALDWTVSLFFRPDPSKVEVPTERELAKRRGTAPALPAPEPAGAHPPGPGPIPAPGHP